MLTIAAAAGGAVVLLSVARADRQLVINTSPSVQPGVGTIVEFRLPPAAWPYIKARVPDGMRIADWYLLKPVVAGPGDRVDTKGGALVVNGRAVGPMPPPRDAAGRPLPMWQAARRLRGEEYFT